jgi:hypothetical protein
MSPDAKQILIKKIEGLSPEQRKRVEGYVDALSESTDSDLGNERKKSSGQASPEENEEEEYLDLSLRGALKHLRDRYTSVQLQHKIQEEWRKQVADS